MKTVITVFLETPEDLINSACKVRGRDDNTPSLPQKARLVIENNMTTCQIQNADGFELSAELERDVVGILKALAGYAGIDLHIT